MIGCSFCEMNDFPVSCNNSLFFISKVDVKLCHKARDTHTSVKQIITYIIATTVGNKTQHIPRDCHTKKIPVLQSHADISWSCIFVIMLRMSTIVSKSYVVIVRPETLYFTSSTTR